MKKRWIAATAMAIGGGAYLYWGNTVIDSTYYIYESEKVPKSFEDFRIVQVSDLHNKAFGEAQHKLLEKIRQMQPDVIVVTGDIVDKRREGEEHTFAFFKEAVKLAPVYFVSGNHECSAGNYSMLKTKLRQYGVLVLDNDSVSLWREGEDITLMGIGDWNFFPTAGSYQKTLQRMDKDKKGLRILLSHRPERMPDYVRQEIDLVFAGHAHGGQIRLPGVKGLFAPTQGILPKYTSGVYQEGGTTLFVSRGLGDSIFPLRVGNRPQLITVSLRCKKP